MRVLLTAGLLVIPATALAADPSLGGFYAGAGASKINFNVSGDGNAQSQQVPGEPEWTALELIGGYKHSPFVGVETRIGTSSSSPDLLYGSIYYRTESANDTAKTYLLFGFTSAQIETATKDLSVSGFSYGAGVGFPLGSSFNLNLEYRILVDDSDLDLNMGAFGLNLDYRFSGIDFGFSRGASVSTSAAATDYESGFYAGLGLAQIDLNVKDEYAQDEYDDEDDSGPDLKWNAVELIGGYSHNPLATVELRLGTTDNEGDDGVDLSLNYVSAYYRPSLNLGKVELYGLLGYSSVRLNFDEESYYDEYDDELIEGESGSETFSGLSFGAGVNASVTDKLSLGLEYRVLAKDEQEDEGLKETSELRGMSANVLYRF